jgi:hypothetical protein
LEDDGKDMEFVLKFSTAFSALKYKNNPPNSAVMACRSHGIARWTNYHPLFAIYYSVKNLLSSKFLPFLMILMPGHRRYQHRYLTSSTKEVFYNEL